MPTPQATLANFEQALNAHLVNDVMAQFNANPSLGLTTDKQIYVGTAQVRAVFDTLMTAFKDFNADKSNVIFEAGSPPPRAVVQAVLSGTHRGVWNPGGKDTSQINGHPPTGKKFVDLPACAIFEFDASGLISHLSIYFDRAFVMNSLGI